MRDEDIDRMIRELEEVDIKRKNWFERLEKIRRLSISGKIARPIESNKGRYYCPLCPIKDTVFIYVLIYRRMGGYSNFYLKCDCGYEYVGENIANG